MVAVFSACAERGIVDAVEAETMAADEGVSAVIEIRLELV